MPVDVVKRGRDAAESALRLRLVDRLLNDREQRGRGRRARTAAGMKFVKAEGFAPLSELMQIASASESTCGVTLLTVTCVLLPTFGVQIPILGVAIRSA